MTELDINNLPANLHVVNELVAKYIKEGCLSFDEKLTLMYFFKDYGDIGALFFLEKERQSYVSDFPDFPISVSIAKEIFTESQAFLKQYRDNRNILDEFEVKTDCDKYLAPFAQKWETTYDYSQKVYQEYLEIYHQVESWAFTEIRDTDEYANLLIKCDELYDQQKEASSKAMNAREELEMARHKLYGLENLNFKWLYLAHGKREGPRE